MRWLVDECVNGGLISHLRATGHNVVYVAEIGRLVSDVEIMAQARREDRLLLTEDKDFGDLVFRRGRSVPGIVLLRLDPAKHELKKVRLDAAIRHFEESLLGRYTVVEEARFRARALPQRD